MKILAIGDPHFKPKNLAFMTWAVDDICHYAEQNQPDLCVILGDTLDTHERLNMRCHVLAVDFFKRMAKICPTVVLIGNHDRETNNDFCSDYHPFTGLDQGAVANLTIVAKPWWDHHRNLMFVPYVPNGRFLDALALGGYDLASGSLPAKNPRIIFAHQEFRGCQFNTGVSQAGDPWNENLPPVVSGHIHKYHLISGVMYVGTFLSTSYGEDNNKAITLLDLPDLGRSSTEIEALETAEAGETSTENSAPPGSPSASLVTVSTTMANFQKALPYPGYTFTRYPLPSFCPRMTLEMNYQDLVQGTWTAKVNVVPPPIRMQDLKQSATRQSGTMIRVQLTLTSEEKKVYRQLSGYRALEDTCDQINVKVINDEISLAKKIIDVKVQQQHKIPSFDEVFQGLIADEPKALELFHQEIKQGTV